MCTEGVSKLNRCSARLQARLTRKGFGMSNKKVTFLHVYLIILTNTFSNGRKIGEDGGLIAEGFIYNSWFCSRC
jgi:hypothetical protein